VFVLLVLVLILALMLVLIFDALVCGVLTWPPLVITTLSARQQLIIQQIYTQQQQ
jgi:hypothetical protein